MEDSKEYAIPSCKVGGAHYYADGLFGEPFAEEKIFEDYYLSDSVYFRLKQASSCLYVSRGIRSIRKDLDLCVFDDSQRVRQAWSIHGYLQGRASKYYSSRDYTAELEDQKPLRPAGDVREADRISIVTCRGIREEWLRKSKIYDKVMTSSVQARQQGKTVI